LADRLGFGFMEGLREKIKTVAGRTRTQKLEIRRQGCCWGASLGLRLVEQKKRATRQVPVANGIRAKTSVCGTRNSARRLAGALETLARLGFRFLHIEAVSNG